MHLKNLKKYYFIDEFNPNHLKVLDKNISLIWRSKYKPDKNELIYKLVKFCKKNKRKLFISNNVRLAIKLKLNGAYISASNKNYDFNSYKLKKNFKIIGSGHNLKEINIKKQQNIKEIFISPIFKYKNKNALGIHKSRFFFNDKSYEKIALGGIDDKNLNLLKLTNFSGIAAINYFKKKGPK
tara:strand:- start:787 stop:1332 length:546 start_codon:yes stop_codon:yes gene_type:complete